MTHGHQDCNRMNDLRPHRAPGNALETVLLLAILSGGYALRLTTPTVRGEESRLAVAARAMPATGTWSYLQQQGRPYLDRPPLHAALMAIAGACRGGVDRAAIRLPSALAVALTALLLLLYGRAFLSATAAWAAAIAYPTMLQVLELGRLGESDTLFALFISAALLLWHLGYSRGWPRALTWAVGYSFAALGALTKGVQAPAYFCTATFLYLALRRDWRYLFASSHLLGLTALAAILVPWAAAVSRGTDAGAAAVWFAVLQRHAGGITAASFAAHLLWFPFVAAGCMLPWSLLLLARGAALRDTPAPISSGSAIFPALCLLIGFVSCWLWPGPPRYLLPLYPCAALLVGFTVEELDSARDGTPPRLAWTRFARGFAVAMLIAAVAVLLLSAIRSPVEQPWAQPRAFAAGYAALAGTLGVVTWYWATSRRRAARRGVIAAIAAFMVLTVTGVVGNQLRQSGVDAAGAVRRLKQALPRGARLVSLGPVHHLFAYLYGEPIAIHPWSDEQRAAPPPGTYFCIDQWSTTPLALPFAWEHLATISTARAANRTAYTNVFVGRVAPEEPR